MSTKVGNAEEVKKAEKIYVKAQKAYFEAWKAFDEAKKNLDALAEQRAGQEGGE